MIVPKGVSVKGTKIANMLAHWAKNEFSRRSLYKEIIGTEYKMRWQTFLNDFRKYSVAFKGWKALKSLPKGNRISKDYFIEPKTTIVDEKYAYIYRSEVLNTDTGRIKVHYLTAGSNILETKMDMIIRIEQEWLAPYLKDNEKIINSDIESVYKGRSF